MVDDDPIMDATAERYKAIAKSLAPVKTGRYRDSIKSFSLPGRDGVRDRGIVATHRWAASIENGWLSRDGVWHPGHHTMRKAARR
jgi:hypothetical protein